MSLFQIEAEYFDGAVKMISWNVFNDERGFFSVPYREDEFAKLGLPTNFVQDNHSRSKRNVVRGLHFQLNPPMGKLMRVVYGDAYLVAVDIRPESPTFLKYIGGVLSDNSNIWFWAEAGFARGFAALSEGTEVQYKCTAMQNHASDSAILWNDPYIGISWPIDDPILSERDRNAPPAVECLKSKL
jgi:dTDP-4-dehydrorhamnose 3,5-epimerase